VAVFVAGLVLAGISMLVAQHREIRRRDAAKAGEADPMFGLFWWSWVWNWISLVTFVVAVGSALCYLSAISLAGS
jgi:hypothetical protein